MTTAPPPAGRTPAPDPRPTAPDDAHPTGADTGVGATRRHHLNEDWLATLVGLALLALVLTGVLGEGIVP